MFTRVVIRSVSHTTNELSKFQAIEVLSRYGQYRPLVLKSRERLLAVFAHNFLLAGGAFLLAGSIRVEAIHDDSVGARCVCV